MANRSPVMRGHFRIHGCWCLGKRFRAAVQGRNRGRSEEHTSELQSQSNLVCRLLLEKKNLKGARAKDVVFVPGEHDVLNDDGKQYLERYGKEAKGAGWYSFDKKGVHFIRLVNVRNLKAGGLGTLGHEQLEWLEDDVKHLQTSTPIIVFAHIPLWSVYPEWGWGTEDSGQALAYLKRFGSVTVLNGHIHQTMQKIEGNVTFHTAASTAFPQPQPGKADSPGPMKVPADQLKSGLGITDVNYVQGQHARAVVDSSLA